jgi:hypothetical protein
MSKFHIYHEGHDDEPKVIEAYDHEDAAEQYAEAYDSDGDYTCVGGTSLELRVVSANGIEKTMIVYGETVARYNAHEKKEKKQ